MARPALEFLVYFGALFALVLAFAPLAAATRRRSVHYTLFLLLGCTAWFQWQLGLYVAGGYRRLPHLLLTHVPALLFAAPLIYFLVEHILRPGFRYERSHLLHAIPGVLSAMILVPFFLQDGALKWRQLQVLTAGVRDADAFASSMPGMKYLWQAFLYLSPAAIPVYAIPMLMKTRVLWKRDASPGRETSALRRTSWLIGCFVVAALLTLAGQAQILLGIDVETDLKLWGSAVVTACLIAAMYMVLRDPGYYDQLTEEVRDKIERAGYKKSRLANLDVKDLSTRLDALMKERRLYRDEDLALSDVAAELSVSPSQLSELLNVERGRNFNQFVNEYRVAYARELLRLSGPDAPPILDVAFESGFRSKSSFYNAFVKIHGGTPLAYRNEAGDNPEAGIRASKSPES